MKILIIGAGRSSTELIDYLLKQATIFKWSVTVADFNVELAKSKVNNHPQGHAVWLDVKKHNDRQDLIKKADIVVSMLPAFMHLPVAEDCIRFKKHFISASYVSNELQELADQVKDNGLLFMGEMGLDPGIDHMSAMQKIDEIKAAGGKLTAFRSYTGGLIAPESDDNPWHYKFTWNPRNVVLAGQGTAQFIQDGKYRYTPYRRIFSQHQVIDILGMGEYEVYPNRDSLVYKDVYGLNDIPNMVRGTIRHTGFCDAWHVLVKIGLTDDSYPIVHSDKMTYYDFVNAYVGDFPGKTIRDRVANLMDISIESEVMTKLDWLGLFSKKKIKLKNASPAKILETLLLEKWTLKSTDKDMIIMQHEFEYELDGQEKHLTTTLVLKGKDDVHTAMAQLVGLPLGIFVKLVITGKVKLTGVNIPVMSQVYNQVLEELEEYGVIFKEKEVILSSEAVN